MLIILVKVIGVVAFGIIYTCTSFIRAATDGNVELHEVCHGETYEIKCPDDHLIIMRSARVGRMRLGRCVRYDYGFVGCYLSVLNEMTVRCSGLNYCKVEYSDSTWNNVNPCRKEFRNHLDFSYTCVKALVDCPEPNVIPLSFPKGYISSEAAVEKPTRCGFGENRAIMISIKPGQSIKLTLHDFEEKDEKYYDYTPCIEYATIVDDTRSVTKSICGGKGVRERETYHSYYNTIFINLFPKNSDGSIRRFLIEYEVVGCEDLHIPNSVIMKDGESVRVKCQRSSDIYEVKCENNTWMGTIPDCNNTILTNPEINEEEFVQEVCEGETFLAQCSQGLKIRITEALIGRMASSSCSTLNYGTDSIGCQQNVTSIMALRCSGAELCHISSPFGFLVNPADPPCPRDLRVYMKVTYWCEYTNN